MTPSSHATVSVTISPSVQHGSPVAGGGVSDGIVALAVIGAWLLGRVWQFFRDVSRGIGPKHGKRS